MNAKMTTHAPYRFNWLPVILLGALAALMAGCASVPEGSPEMKQQALSFTPPPGKAGVYLIRPYHVAGSAVLWNVKLDYQDCGSVETRSYLYCEVLPGEHIPMFARPGAPLLAEAGKNYFFTINYGKFEQLSEADGQALVQKFKISKENRYKAPFLPETVDSATPAACRVVLSQDDPFVVAQKAMTGTINFIFVPSGNVLVDIFTEAIFFNGRDEHEKRRNERRNERANKRLQDQAAKMGAPLAGHGLGASVRNDFQSSLSAALGSSPWLHTTPLKMTGENKQVMAEEVNQHPVVQINLIYYLSCDASTLIMQAHLLYFRQSQTNATYDRYYTYFSEPVGPERDDAAVAKWVASDQELLHRRMSEGVHEIIAMLDLDFFHRGPMNPANGRGRISVIPFSHVQRDGYILRRENSRILFQEDRGNIFSIIPD